MSPRYDLPKAAPQPLRLVQLFVNTVDLEHGREWLSSPAELGKWLREAGLGSAQPTAGDVSRARELREALRALLVTNNGARVDADAVATVNRAARAARLSVELEARGRLRFDVAGSGVDAALGRIVVVVFEALADSSWARLKTCPNCRWSFYDYSRNRSAKWCSMELCGNRLKTRSYRRRRAAH